MRAYAKTDIGKVRETNEDSYISASPLFAVADGMGGHVAGEIASRLATDTLNQYVANHAGEPVSAALLETAIHEANSLIFRLAQEKSECAGMGTTITAVYVSGSKIFWGHVGDSRLYLLRGDELRQITDDHSLVGALVRSGSISKEEAHTHPQRNILTRAVGTDEHVKVDSGEIDLVPGDSLLLCTDGLTTMVRDEDIQQGLSAGPADGDACMEALVAAANTAGGYDNITAILLRPGEG
ncbi:MAG: Stp1/IreP family PP2C-type Ser/Thr phosphatase [Negativicutes bacterium]|nr:Stp1/IreP family PP2C-type Ser/Thr phosphatase [Negativicutes bacterium]